MLSAQARIYVGADVQVCGYMYIYAGVCDMVCMRVSITQYVREYVCICMVYMFSCVYCHYKMLFVF